MAYYAAFLPMLDVAKNAEVLPRHIDYLDKLDADGKVFARGPFHDGSGGLVVYIADSFEAALDMASHDPHVLEQSRGLELKEWKLIRAFHERD